MTNDALRRTLAERINEQWAGTFKGGAINEWHVADVALAALGLDDLDAAAERMATVEVFTRGGRRWDPDELRWLLLEVALSATEEGQS